MIEFFKDRFGVCVYYESMNPDRGCNRNLIINGDVKFDTIETCIVPNVKTLVDPTTNSSINFVITDITYSADERMVPLRHLDDSHINYFTVDGKKVAVSFATRLCENAGLKAENNGYNRKEYRIGGGYNYDALGNWTIEGKNYSEYLKPMKLSSTFTGHLVECREYLNQIEQNVRQCFDRWAINDKCPDGLTTGVVIDHLRAIEKHVRSIDTKKKTQRNWDMAMQLIASAKQEITTIALEDHGVSDEEVNDGV